jgi:dolichol kinase
MLAVAVTIVGVFLVAEWLRLRFRVCTEATRKFVHIAAGTITLRFPHIFTSQLSVLILSIGFAGLLTLSKRWKTLNSVNAIDRKSWGSLAYPAVVYLCFASYMSHANLLMYYLPLLIFILCDPLAAWIGLRTRWIPYRVWHDGKTVGGSLAFLTAALIISIVGLSLATELQPATTVAYAAAIALATTVAEAASPFGLDNLFVPVTALIMLILMLP